MSKSVLLPLNLNPIMSVFSLLLNNNTLASFTMYIQIQTQIFIASIKGNFFWVFTSSLKLTSKILLQTINHIYIYAFCEY